MDLFKLEKYNKIDIYHESKRNPFYKILIVLLAISMLNTNLKAKYHNRFTCIKCAVQTFKKSTGLNVDKLINIFLFVGVA